MEILRERELRESIEKQMMEDQRSRGKLFTTRFHSAISLNIKLFNGGVCVYRGSGKEREKGRAVAQLSSYSID
jgi:hypothetical protein